MQHLSCTQYINGNYACCEGGDILICSCICVAGMLVISHDQHFIQSVCNEIWVVGDGRVKQFNGSFEDYKKIALEHTTKTANNQVLKKK